MAWCAIKFCGKTNRTSNYQNEGITFHRFPKVGEQKNLWIHATCRKDWSPTPFSVVCSRHFTETDFHYLKNRRKLVENAIPTLNLPGSASKTIQELTEKFKNKYNFGQHLIPNLEKYLEDPEDSPAIKITVKSKDPKKAESSKVKEFKSQIFKGCKNKILNLNAPININADLIESEPKKTTSLHLKCRPKDYFKIILLSEEEMLSKREMDKVSAKYTSFPYRCDKCILGFDDECLYQRHVKDAHEFAGKYVCPVCDMRVARPANFRQHVENHYRYFQCKKCNFGHHNYRMLVTHARKHRRTEAQEKSGKPKKKSKRQTQNKPSRIPILLGDLQL